MAKNTNTAKTAESQSKDISVKICKTCLRNLPATLDYFTKNSKSKDGLVNHCKECANKRSRELRRVNGLTKRDLKNRENFIFDSSNNPVLRKCSRCKEWKPVDYFHNEKNGYLGKMSRCKECFKFISECRKTYNMKNRVNVKTKVCTKCGQEKPISKFHVNKWSPDGRSVRCAECVKNYCKEYYTINSESVKERMRLYLITPQGRMKKKEWERNNHDKRMMYRSNPKAKQTIRSWWKNNPNKLSEYKKRRKSTPKGALDARVGAHMRLGLKNGTSGRRWLELIPYSLQELYDHLDKTMPDGYDWDDYKKGELQVDHIIPLAAFPYETSDNINFQKAWSLENLQLLPKLDNLKKWAKLEKPFQPYLGFTLKKGDQNNV